MFNICFELVKFVFQILIISHNQFFGLKKKRLHFYLFAFTDGSAIDEKETRMTRRSTKRAAEQEEDRKSIKSCKLAIQTLLGDIKQHRDSWPFMEPVTKDEVPDYYEYITHPMDFGTIKSKFDSDTYVTVQQFAEDCMQIFKNCEIYNRENSVVYK